MLNFKRVLILSPHTDDGEFAAGGTAVRFIEEGVNVYYAAFSCCEDTVPAGYPRDILRTECANSTKTLGMVPERVTLLDYTVRTFPEHRQEILDKMVRLNETIQPELVLIPSSSDLHQDHQTIHREALRAFKKSSSVWGYEHPWNNLSFTTDVFVNLEEGHLVKKIEAIKKYQSQLYHSYLNEEYITALARSRGTQVELQYAEAFELIRLLVK